MPDFRDKVDHIVAPPVSDKYRPDSRRAGSFKFNMLGVRVPSIIVSPYIAPGTIDSTIYDHTSIIATARKIFGIKRSLTKRDKNAKTFEHLLNNPMVPLDQIDLPEPHVDIASSSAPLGMVPKKVENRPLNDLQLDLLKMTRLTDAVKGKSKTAVARNFRRYKKARVSEPTVLTAESGPVMEKDVEAELLRHTQEFDSEYGISRA